MFTNVIRSVTVRFETLAKNEMSESHYKYLGGQKIVNSSWNQDEEVPVLGSVIW